MSKDVLTINVTGHRPNKFVGGYNIHNESYQPVRAAIKRAIMGLINEHKPKEVIVYSGMALGIDQIFVECAADARLYYKEKGIDFKIIAAIPCHDQDGRWQESSKRLYKKLLETCDKQVMVTDSPYKAGCMEIRNQYMVDNSDCTIAVWDGSRGGTGNCVKDAVKAGNEIIRINPNDNFAVTKMLQ